MRDLGTSAASDMRATNAPRRDVRDRMIGLLGVLFYGTWMIIFVVATIVMVIIVATGDDNPAHTLLVAVMCAAFAVFNGWRLPRPLRRLRGTQRPHVR